jgi:hypothetical protein
MRTKRTYVMGAVGLVLTLAILTSASPGTAKPGASGASVVGVAEIGQTVFEFVGRIDQDDRRIAQGEPQFLVFGYLTRLAGLADEMLFVGPLDPRTAGTARFTFHGVGDLTARSIVIDPATLEPRIFTLNLVGQLRFYFNEVPSADFSVPASFAAGQEIGAGDVQVQTVLTVYAPLVGMAQAWGEIRQTSAGSFFLDGRMHRFGRIGLTERLEASGHGARFPPLTDTISIVDMVGNGAAVGGLGPGVPIRPGPPFPPPGLSR